MALKKIFPILLSAFVASSAFAEPSSGTMRYSFSNRGTLRAQIVLDEAPGTGVCHVTPGLQWGQGAQVSAVKMLNTYAVAGNSKVVVLRALRMPRLRGKAQRLNLKFAVNCGGSEFTTNVFARFIDCAQQQRFSRKAWEARLKGVLRWLR